MVSEQLALHVMCFFLLIMHRIPDVSAGVAVLVMGITGVGKSTFISKLIGGDTGIGHDLTSCEYSLRPTCARICLKLLTCYLDTKGVEFHSMRIKNRPVYLVDTPGYNDTYRSDFEIFSEIAFILSQIYRRGMNIAGILYLHRISDNRVSGSSLRNFKLLETMCGLDAAPRMRLVTTMWDTIKGEGREATLRESQLLNTSEFWGRFAERGSQVKRWQGDEWSALSIVDELISSGDTEGYPPLLIQRELVDEGKPLKETTAGVELMSEYTRAENELSREIRSLQSDRSVAQYDAMAGLSELVKEIREMKDAQKKLRESTRELFTEREKSYSKLLSKMHHEQRELSRELQAQKRQHQQLQDEMKSNDKLRADEKSYWNQKRAALEHQARIGRRRRNSVEMELQRIQEEESHLYEQLSDVDQENESLMLQTSQGMDMLRKRDVAKRNMLCFLGVLAGVGLTAAGAVTGMIPLAGAGVGLTLTSASDINLSRKTPHGTPYMNYHPSGSFISNSSTSALNGAQISTLF